MSNLPPPLPQFGEDASFSNGSPSSQTGANSGVPPLPNFVSTTNGDQQHETVDSSFRRPSTNGFASFTPTSPTAAPLASHPAFAPEVTHTPEPAHEERDRNSIPLQELPAASPSASSSSRNIPPPLPIFPHQPSNSAPSASGASDHVGSPLPSPDFRAAPHNMYQYPQNASYIQTPPGSPGPPPGTPGPQHQHPPINHSYPPPPNDIHSQFRATVEQPPSSPPLPSAAIPPLHTQQPFPTPQPTYTTSPHTQYATAPEPYNPPFNHSPGQIDHPNNQHAPPNYIPGFFSCLSSPSTCCLSFWCPCILYSRTKSALATTSSHSEKADADFSSCNSQCTLFCALSVCMLSPFLTLFQRGRIRTRYNLPQGAGVYCCDCLKACCCTTCTLIQDDRQVRERELELFTGAGPGAGGAVPPPKPVGQMRMEAPSRQGTGGSQFLREGIN
ncbi:hypothetical protein BJ508DRAFT_155053 [Ascobolus immersus RN42]|uniref:PLAC8-domain-containing protein n=1 Tax=Ascobolus immersus RN42 TaxID=1160509 RepID=A0A3N4I351_ASCIM|nr:hypothetical protein BJ508DRAFT_155053 [Ascobolus immersus RN42]